MTYFERDNLGVEFNPNRNIYVAYPLEICPNKKIVVELKEQFVNEAELSDCSSEYSFVFYIPYTDKILGYLLVEVQDIPHYAEVFKGQTSFIEFLSNAHGLYIRKMVLHPNLGNEGVVFVLNLLHTFYCDSDFKDKTKYIWMDYNGEILFSPTWQEYRFYDSAPNRVAKALGIPLCGTDFTEYSMFK